MAEGAISTILSAAYGILCARIWGPEISGIASLAFTLASVFSFISCFSIEQIVIARYAVTKEHQTLFASTLLIRTTGVGLSAIGIGIASLSIGNIDDQWRFLPLLAFTHMGLTTLDLFRLRSQALTTLHHQVTPRLIIAIAFFGAKCACLTILPPAESVWITLWLAVIESALYLAVSILVTQTYTPLIFRQGPGCKKIIAESLDLLKASAPLFVAGMLVMLFFKLDYFFLGKLATPKDLGLYASSMRILEMYVGIASLALLQLYPNLAKNHRSGIVEYQANLRQFFIFAYLASAGIVLFNALIGKEIVLFLLGPAYLQVAEYSTYFCLLSIPLLSGTVRGFAISLNGLHRNHLYAAISGFVIIVPALMVFIPELGFRGALIADLAAYTMSAMISSWLLPSLRGIAAAQWMPLKMH